MAYETNRFCWYGIISTDVEKAKAFYGEALGYKVLDADMGGDTVSMFVANEVPVGHFAAPPMPGVPSHWQQYIRVDDVDASVKKAEQAGGKVVVPAMDIPPGRFSFVSSPSGAVIGLFHEADYDQAAHHPGGVGSVHWTELHSTDLDADRTWLKAVFNYEISEMPMPDGKYYILNHNGTPQGGAMAAFMPGAPSAWLSWVEVDDADAAASRVKQHGGQILGDMMDMEGIGRMVVAQDPTGGVFGIIKPAKQG